MIKLNSIKINDIIGNRVTYGNIDTYFPFSKKYIDSPEFQNEKYEWFYITNDEFRNKEEQNTWIGLVCLTENKYVPSDNLHLSVIEVASPILGLNIGTEILDRIIDIARDNNYKTLTLQIQDANLIKFYVRFGFAYDNIGGRDVYVLYL